MPKTPTTEPNRIATLRQNETYKLVRTWVRKYRPDVWEAAKRAAEVKYPFSPGYHERYIKRSLPDEMEDLGVKEDGHL